MCLAQKQQLGSCAQRLGRKCAHVPLHQLPGRLEAHAATLTHMPESFQAQGRYAIILAAQACLNMQMGLVACSVVERCSIFGEPSISEHGCRNYIVLQTVTDIDFCAALCRSGII